MCLIPVLPLCGISGGPSSSWTCSVAQTAIHFDVPFPAVGKLYGYFRMENWPLHSQIMTLEKRVTECKIIVYLNGGKLG